MRFTHDIGLKSTSSEAFGFFGTKVIHVWFMAWSRGFPWKNSFTQTMIVGLNSVQNFWKEAVKPSGPCTLPGERGKRGKSTFLTPVSRGECDNHESFHWTQSTGGLH